MLPASMHGKMKVLAWPAPGEPGLAFVCRACDYYGVSADFLLGRAPSPTCTPEQLEALRVLVQDVRTAADRAEAALEEIAL